MAFNVQNDTGTVTDANAYVTVQEFREYWASRGVSFSETDTDLQALIVKATQYIDFRFTYKAAKLEGRDQTTQFPRYALYDKEGYLTEGVPLEIKEACSEYAKAENEISVTGNSSNSEPTLTGKTETVGPISRSYQYVENTSVDSSSENFSVVQVADNILKRSGFVLDVGGLPIRG